MKSFLYIVSVPVILILSIASVYAQVNEESSSQMVLTLKIPESIADLSDGQIKKLEAKVLSILTKQGVGSQGQFSPFTLTPAVNFYDSEIVEGLRKLYVVKGEFSLSVGLNSGEVFSSETVELIGSGTSEQQAKNNFINKVSSKSKRFEEMFSQAADEVRTYYANNCDRIMNEVTNLRNTEKYEQALTRLLAIPSYAEACHGKASQLIKESYQEFQDKSCQRLINIAQNSIALRHYQAAVEALAQINPQSSCYDQSLPLKEEIKAATQDYYDKIWQQKQDELQGYKEVLIEKYKSQTTDGAPVVQILTPTRSNGSDPTTIYGTRVVINGKIHNPKSTKKVIIDGIETSLNEKGEFSRVLLLDSESSRGVKVEAVDTNGNTTVKELNLKKSQAPPPPNHDLPNTDPKDLKKVALVMGNDNYTFVNPLKNAINDAKSMEKTLQSLGFEVTPVFDADNKTMKSQISDFMPKTKGADVVLFYFAGHGFEINGINFLLPIDYNNQEQAININEILKKLGNQEQDDLNIVILDACRDLPEPSADSKYSGFAIIRPPSGTLIAYATAPGAKSFDGTSTEGNGVYTGQLIKQMIIPQRIEDVFMKTRRAVLERTNKKQQPWEEWSLNNVFYLKTK